MRKLFTGVLIAAVIVVAVALYLLLTTPKTGARLHLPPGGAQRDLLAVVPQSAEAFALVPSAASLHRRLLANPLTSKPVADWTARQQLPRPWMIGNADLVAWRSGRQTSYAMRLDPLRSLLVRLYLLVGSAAQVRIANGMFLINVPPDQAIGGQTLDDVLPMTSGMPDADALVVQRTGSRGAFPPIARPAVTSVVVEANDVVLISRARSNAPARPAFRAQFPRAALLAATFGEAPRIAGDLDRLLGSNVSSLLGSGGSVILYDVDAGTLLPRPEGLLSVAANDANRERMQRMAKLAAAFGEMREAGGRILLAFDRSSLARYQADSPVTATWPAGDWALRLDPKRMVPLVEKLGGSAGLRIAAPHIYRSARDLRKWIGNLSAAEAVEVAHSSGGGTEELRVRINAK